MTLAGRLVRLASCVQALITYSLHGSAIARDWRAVQAAAAGIESPVWEYRDGDGTRTIRSGIGAGLNSFRWPDYFTKLSQNTLVSSFPRLLLSLPIYGHFVDGQEGA